MADARSWLALTAGITGGLVVLGVGGPASAQGGVGAGPPAIAFAEPQRSVLEHAGAARISVELSAPAGRAIAVPFEVGGSATRSVDYEVSASPLVIPAGERRGAIVVTLLDDDENENTETVELVLRAPGQGAVLGDQLAHVLAIQDFRLGDPIEGLTAAELASFARGRKLFEKRFKRSEGLGPFYNATACASCHSKPVTGGAADLYRNFFLAVYYFNDSPAQQSDSIPPFLSQVVPAFGSGDYHLLSGFTLEGGRPLIPPQVLGFPVIAAQRNSIPVFGTGLFEFISDETILANADPLDADLDGISGRINTQLNGAAVGRFGTKAQANNVELFTRGPLMNQMGITSDPLEGAAGIVSLSMLQVPGGINDPSFDGDGVPDPEISPHDLADLIAFTRFLAPPLKQPFDDAARRGELLFEQLGCARCHIPSLPGSRGPVDAYTDLLTHDLGPELADNIKLGDSAHVLTDFRTQPLWGIGAVGPYLHDGRASSLERAIVLHGGEGQASRDGYLGLSPAEQADVISFLEHL